MNTPGTIDSDYRGEIKVIIFNHGDADFEVNNGDRIAQMILTPVIKMELEETNKDFSDDTFDRYSYIRMKPPNY